MSSESIPRSARIWVTGHRGLVGSAVVRRLKQAGFETILTASRTELDLRDQAAVRTWVQENRPEYVVHVAGKVGGILANSQSPADFLYDNLLIHATVLRAACEQRVQKLLYLGSSCIYPRDCAQPIREDALLTGPLEKTNFGYAIAKIAGLLSCQAYREQFGMNFISAMPTNLYGPHDNFDLSGSHVVPALIRKCSEARQQGERNVTVWGTGTPRREFLHVDDLADACLFLLEHYDSAETINIGTGEEVTIQELAEQIRNIVHPEAELRFDTSKPDGTPRKLLDVSRLHALGWRHRFSLREGLEQTCDWYLSQGAGNR
ncbi:MAG TPA: GDP-L-fucose synthase [Planctomycetaceae bacterium]|nr:GDP-L-fucose synthase [Planctomycetaceae bacterium]